MYASLVFLNYVTVRRIEVATHASASRTVCVCVCPEKLINTSELNILCAYEYDTISLRRYPHWLAFGNVDALLRSEVTQRMTVGRPATWQTQAPPIQRHAHCVHWFSCRSSSSFCPLMIEWQPARRWLTGFCVANRAQCNSIITSQLGDAGHRFDCHYNQRRLVCACLPQRWRAFYANVCARQPPYVQRYQLSHTYTQVHNTLARTHRPQWISVQYY